MSTINTTGGPDPAVMAAIEKGNAVVFFDMVLGDDENAAELGRIKLELFVNDVRTFAFYGCHRRRIPSLVYI
jgi:hypothetical protein